MTTLTESKISDIYSHLPSMFLTQDNSKLKLEQTHTIFFKGKVKNIFLFRDLLTLLSDIVESRFYKPEFKRFFDPVITCEDDKLRMECFSSDTSIYCRVDLVKELFEEYSNIYRGTTNVNFNKNFLDSLASLRNSSETFFEVGKENVVLEVNDKKVKEKKVKLPDRWIRGFLESQAIYRKAEKVFELKGLASKKFLADCSLSMKDKEYFLVSKNSGIELLTNQPKNGVFIPVQGLSRLSILKKIIPHVNGLSVYWVKETGATLWLIKTEGGNISFATSSSVKNGFSGEGESLRSFTLNRDESLDDTALEKIKEMNTFTAKELANFLEIEEEKAIPIIDSLSMAGVLGYDVIQEKFFYRVLPFIDQKNSRFDNSKELLKKSNVELKEVITSEEGLKSKGIVKGTTDSYNVEVFVDKNGYIESAKCECEWFDKNELKRGPCKHILALRLFSESSI